MRCPIIIASIVLATTFVGCRTVETTTLPTTREVYPGTKLVVSGVTNSVSVEERLDYASVAVIEFRDAADKVVESRYSYLPMSETGESFTIVSAVPKNAKTVVIDKVDTQPEVLQVSFSKFDTYCGNGGFAANEKSIKKIDALSDLVTDELCQNPADALEGNIGINDICPIRFEVDVVGAGMDEYRRNAVLCQVEFKDADGNLLKATGVSSNERYGDWFYIGVAPGENHFTKTIQPPKGAKSLTLKLSRFYNKYDLSVQKFEVVH